jgi:chromosomal replication initiator protein
VDIGLTHQPLNERYTFGTFVVGRGNRSAYEAALQIVHGSGAATPLLLCGSAGSGKTHLMQAICRELRKLRPGTMVYCSVEALTNAMVSAIKKREYSSFVRSSLAVDVLLIDDIQFLSGKERTQEAFAQICEHLQGHGKRLVVAGWSSANELSGDRAREIETSIKLLLTGGSIVQIEPPDCETMLAILRQKAASAPLEIPDDLSHFIASHVRDVRELEGALATLTVYASLTGTAMTQQLAQWALRCVTPSPHG